MSEFNIDIQGDRVVATVRSSDKHSDQVLVKFDRHSFREDKAGCSEMYITPNQLELLGRFLVRQAQEINAEQRNR